MKTPTIKRALPWNLLLLLSTFCALHCGCSKTEPASHAHDSKAKSNHVFSGEYPIQVLCTTGQVAELLKHVGGDHINVTALMGPGIDPHLFRPDAEDTEKLIAADAIFYNGLHLEGRLADKLVQLARRKATFAVTEGIQERKDKRLREPPEFDGMVDPHVWHDVALWSDCVHDVAGMLGKFDPKHAKDYDENAHNYMTELSELHIFCKSEIAKIPESRRVLVTAHDAFGYFSAAYKIEVAALKGISTDEEKDLAHQDEVQALIIERKIPAVFVESAINPRAVESLIETCKAAGWSVINGGELYADALGEAGSEASTYTGMIRSNVKTIVAALNGE